MVFWFSNVWLLYVPPFPSSFKWLWQWTQHIFVQVFEWQHNDAPQETTSLHTRPNKSPSPQCFALESWIPGSPLYTHSELHTQRIDRSRWIAVLCSWSSWTISTCELRWATGWQSCATFSAIINHTKGYSFRQVLVFKNFTEWRLCGQGSRTNRIDNLRFRLGWYKGRCNPSRFEKRCDCIFTT